jgi:tetratricopeptide (TPR) repeat protein
MKTHVLSGISCCIKNLYGYIVGGMKSRYHLESKGLKLQKERGAPLLLPVSYLVLAMDHLALGDLKSARDYAEEGLKLSKEFKTKSYEGLAWIVLGSIVGKADPGHIDVAEKHIRQGISILEQREIKAWYALGYLFLGEFFADADQREKAVENLKKAEAMYLEMKVTPKSHWLARTQAALANQRER